MKVEITESIDIADSAPHMPIVKVVKGETRDDLSTHVANRLIELRCAELVDEKAMGEVAKEAFNNHTNASDVPLDAPAGPAGTGDEGGNVTVNVEGSAKVETPETLKAELDEIALKEMDGPMGSEQKAKAALEALSKERYGFDVDKRKKVEDIIDVIVTEAFKKAE